MQQKTLIGAAIGAVAVIAVAAGYFVSRHGGSQMLSYVPADTVFFAGSNGPVDVRKYLESSPLTAGVLQQVAAERGKMEEAAKSKGAFAHFLAILYFDYLEQLQKGPEHLLTHYGFAEKSESAAYLVGAVPVLRLSLNDSAAFVKAVEAAEKKSGVAPKIESVDGLSVRRYLAKEAADDKPSFELVIATDRNQAVITLDSSKLDDKTRALALGREKPAVALASDKLEKLAKAHELNDDGLFFIDFVELSKSLVAPKNTLLGQHLQLMFGDMPTLAGIQTPACQKEIPAFVANVPRFVGGLKHYQSKSDVVDMTVVYDLEITNAAVLKALSDMRGVLPKHLLAKDNAALFWFGLGLDTDKVGATITTMVRDFGAQNYQCEPLMAMQKSVTSQNLAGLMMFGLARGVKGVSVTAYSLDLANLKAASTDGVDAIITLSAPDPLVLWDMAAKFLPPVTVPKNGDPVDVPLPVGGTVKVALKGHHLVAYVGEKSARAAQQLAGQELTPNGMFSFGYDYSLFTRFASVLDEKTDKTAEMEKAQNLLKSMAGVRVGAVSDFTAAGWRNEVVMRMPKTATAVAEKK